MSLLAIVCQQTCHAILFLADFSVETPQNSLARSDPSSDPSPTGPDRSAAGGLPRLRQVSLRFTAEERCSFLREETREVEDASRSVTEFSVGYAMGLTSKTVTKETQFFWNFEVTYKATGQFHAGVGEAFQKLSFR